MRWFHEAIDRLHVASLHRLMPRVFRHGIESPPLSAHLAAVQLSLPGLESIQHFLSMCAVAMQLGEAVRQALLARGARGSVVVGMSLGGFLALLHHLMLGTADGYVPLLAGPDIAHVMLDTHYRRFLAAQALAHPAMLQVLLDLRQDFQ